jgi:hypothetical protein
MLIMPDGNTALHHAKRMMSSLDEAESEEGCEVLFAATRTVPAGFDESVACLALIRWLIRSGDLSSTDAMEISDRAYEAARTCGRIDATVLSAVRSIYAIAFDHDPDVEMACESFLRGHRLRLV